MPPLTRSLCQPVSRRLVRLPAGRHAGRARGGRATSVPGDADAGDAGEAGAACRSESPPGATHTTCRCTPCAPRRPPATPATGAGPWTRVAAAGGRAAAHIAAHMMPSRPINPPTGSSRTPLGASSLVPSASANNADLRRPLVVGRDPIDGRGPARACRRAPPRRACYTSHVAWFRVLLRPRRRPRSFAPIATHRGRAEDRVRTERDLWPCW